MLMNILLLSTIVNCAALVKFAGGVFVLWGGVKCR